MDLMNVKRYLDSFGNYVVDEAKKNLKKDKGNTALGESIRFTVTPTEKGFSTKFYMNDYGTFLDKGVSGNKEKRSYTSYKNKIESSPYSYTTKGPPIDILSKWVKKKGLKPKGYGRGRDKDTGRYLSGLAIYISHKIKVRGIPSLSFFQIPLGVGYKNLKKEILKELKLDIENYMTTFYRPQ
tara:strand:+ start:89 stop:634 length:546 start_codon:yes stop_codon:yes gene_type:complete